jgi:hypothetical protein
MRLFIRSSDNGWIMGWLEVSYLRDKPTFFFLPFSHTKWGQEHVFNHVVIKIRQLFLRLAACLTSTLLETGVDANDCKCSRDQRLNKNAINYLEIISP